MTFAHWKDGQFVETTVSKIVFDVLERARNDRQCAAIVGAPGVGKTIAIKEWTHRHHVRSYLICTATIAGSMQTLFTEIANILGIYPERGIAATHRAMMTPVTVPVRFLFSMKHKICRTNITANCFTYGMKHNCRLCFAGIQMFSNESTPIPALMRKFRGA